MLVDRLAVIPLRSVMLEKALAADGEMNANALARQAAGSVNVELILTETPSLWREYDFKAQRLSDMLAAETAQQGDNNISVPFLDLKAQLHQFYNEMDSRFHEIIHNTGFILGPYVQKFEKDFADAHEIGHCLGVSTVTDALHIALLALGVGPGDRVLVPVNTFIATAEAVSMVGATPIFVDCDSYWNISVEHCEDLLQEMLRESKPMPKAIIPVHLYGQPADMNGIMAIAERFGLKVIEDCCQAHLARWKGARVGGIGDFGAFSFYPGKNLGAFGEAGALITKNNTLFEQALLVRQHGETQKYHHQIIGHNFRMSALQGAVLGAKLPYLPEWTEKRRKNAHLYNSLLNELKGVQTPLERDGVEAVYHLYVIQADNRDALAKHLNQNGVATGLHYPLPLHLQPAYANLGYQRGGFPVAERAANTMLSLPMYPELTRWQISYVCKLIEAFSEKNAKERCD
jgi:dTDP-4-amino-4,6-dideoxygalactose transaminase